MKRYAFSLNRVLRVRHLQQEVAAQGVRDATRTARRRQADLDDARETYEATVAAAAGLRGAGGTAFAMRELDLAYASEVLDAGQRADEADEAAEVATDEWTASRQRVTGLERLDAAQRAEYRWEVLGEEGRAADDLVTGRHGGHAGGRPGGLGGIGVRPGEGEL